MEIVTSLERYYACSKTIDRLRSRPLGHLFDGFCEWLENQGFSPGGVRKHLTNAGHLNAWLAEQGPSEPVRLSTSLLDGFAAGYGAKRKQEHVRRVGWSISRFRQYLKSIGQFDTENEENVFDPLLDQYLSWMRDHQHASPGTLEVREHSISQFLKWLGADATATGLANLSTERVESFFLSFAEDHGRSARRSMQAALRTFLRFSLYEGHISQALDDAVPAIRTYKLASIPRGLTDQQALAVLAATPRETGVEQRDLAILEMLYAYGIRGGQVRALCLEDVYWEKDQILFRALKQGKHSLVPLTRRVGESLLTYLQNGRPENTGYREVFLTSRAPYHALPRSNALSAIVERRIRAAGVEVSTGVSKGAHAFRHAFASRKLSEGYSLKEIADILGHRHLSTTFQYSKVDATALEVIGLEWPE